MQTSTPERLMVMGGITCAAPAINITRDTPLTNIKDHISSIVIGSYGEVPIRTYKK